MTGDFSDDDDILAAELAFGLIDGEEREAALLRLEGDPRFRQAYALWQDRAVAIFTLSGDGPDPSVWRRIEARLPTEDPAPTIPLRTLRWWQAGTIAASAAAVALGVAAIRKPEQTVITVPVRQTGTAPMLAMLTGEKGLVAMSFDPGSGRVTSTASGLAIGNHSPELWVIPEDGKPRSVGLVEVAAPSRFPVPPSASRFLTDGVTIAVSVEPMGGSRTGQPTGPVILKGKLTRI